MPWEGEVVWCGARRMQPVRIAVSTSALTMCWPRNCTGALGRIACSLPKAMLDPKNETEPITVEKRIGTKVSSGMLDEIEVTWRNSDQEISAAAPPPTPL